MDGLPLYKSSPIGFWPILAKIHGMPDIKPMVVGVWSGVGKPNNLTDFLQPFVHEMNKIAANSISINGNQINVLIRSFHGKLLIDMIKTFPTSDHLHLSDEGVMKRMLNIWTKGTSIHKKMVERDSTCFEYTNFSLE